MEANFDGIHSNFIYEPGKVALAWKPVWSAYVCCVCLVESDYWYNLFGFSQILLNCATCRGRVK